MKQEKSHSRAGRECGRRGGGWQRRPEQVVGPGGGAVLCHQLVHHVARRLELVEVLAEDRLLLVALEERLPVEQLLELLRRALEQLRTSSTFSIL